MQHFVNCVVLLAAAVSNPSGVDWLVTVVDAPVRVQREPGGREIAIENDLIRRSFQLTPNAATIDYVNLSNNVRFSRGVKPEAVIVLDGQRFEVGGLKGQPDYAYLDPAWIDSLTSDPKAFQFVNYDVGEPEAPYPWTPKRHAASAVWPPKGLHLTLHFRAPDGIEPKYSKVSVSVHYEMYVGLPVLAKWVTVANESNDKVVLSGLETEILAVPESEVARLHLESDYSFSGMSTTLWGPDPDYATQVDYELKAPLMTTSNYPLGPGAHLKAGESFQSFRTFELLHDSDDRERQGLARRRMMRLLAPQAMENPIFMHVRQSDSTAVRLAIDQCAEVGFEMVILTFGSGFNIESEDTAYIAAFKADVDYAHAKGIEIGGYTLTAASRDVGEENNVVSPETGNPGSKFGQSACLASRWGDGYFRRVLNFIDATGLDMVETDGPYHGDVCASTKHSGHHDLADSQVAQWRAYVNFVHECRTRGVFINTPDLYYLAGSNKCAMGYRETNFSLPRERQILISRQNIFDGTFDKTPSMGWMFVPLVEYHGGGAAATFEPLREHLPDLEWHFAQNFGSGVQACYRGPRLYDSDETKAMVKKWVDFYKHHQAILDSDIIHVRRADGRGLDCMMHVNPHLEERALAMVYNPTNSYISETIRLPLYYAGLTDKASIRVNDSSPKELPLDRAFTAETPIAVSARSFKYLLVTGAKKMPTDVEKRRP